MLRRREHVSHRSIPPPPIMNDPRTVVDQGEQLCHQVTHAPWQHPQMSGVQVTVIAGPVCAAHIGRSGCAQKQERPRSTRRRSLRLKLVGLDGVTTPATLPVLGGVGQA